MGAMAPSIAAAQGAQTQVNALKGSQRIYMQTSNEEIRYTASLGTFFEVTSIRNIVVPQGQNGYLVATFNAESRCVAGLPASHCVIRVKCDGLELFPNDGENIIFALPGDPVWENVSITRRSALVGGGIHTCMVETGQVGSSNHWLDDWIFSVEFWRKT